MCLSVSLLLLGLSPQETSMAPSFANFQSGEVSFLLVKVKLGWVVAMHYAAVTNMPMRKVHNLLLPLAYAHS